MNQAWDSPTVYSKGLYTGDVVGEGGETWDRGDLGHHRFCLAGWTEIAFTIIITYF